MIIFFLDSGTPLYLKDDEFAFENGQEVTRLLPHDHSDLDRGAMVLRIDSHSLVGARCDLILSGMTSLKNRGKNKNIFLGFFERKLKKCVQNYLPHVQNVLLLVGSQVCVEHQVAVASIELSVGS